MQRIDYLFKSKTENGYYMQPLEMISRMEENSQTTQIMMRVEEVIRRVAPAKLARHKITYSVVPRTLEKIYSESQPRQLVILPPITFSAVLRRAHLIFLVPQHLRLLVQALTHMFLDRRFKMWLTRIYSVL